MTLLGNVSEIEERLMDYGVLGIICIILILAIVYLYTRQQRYTEEQQKFLDERQRAMEERMEKIETNQRETNETFSKVVKIFTATTKTFESQNTLLNDMKIQNEKVQWELGVINQKVDKIQEKQDKLTMKN